MKTIFPVVFILQECIDSSFKYFSFSRHCQGLSPLRNVHEHPKEFSLFCQRNFFSFLQIRHLRMRLEYTRTPAYTPPHTVFSKLDCRGPSRSLLIGKSFDESFILKFIILSLDLTFPVLLSR